MAKTKKYTLTPEHEAQLKPWTEQWIANAMSTAAMTEADRALATVSVREMYRAAKLTPPADERIVFVPSPFVLRFAGGFAAGIQHLRTQGRIVIPDQDYEATPPAAATVRAVLAVLGESVASPRPTRTLTTDSEFWYSDIGTEMRSIADRLVPGQSDFLLSCANASWRMWNGGNQWSGWVAYLSFFRHIAKLNLPEYEQWQHYENAARVSGPRVMHQDFCMVSDRPDILTVDAERRPHSDTGPFCRWRDGMALYAVHGTRMPQWMIEHPERVTAERITAEPNTEVRRVMLDRFGTDRYVTDLGMTPIDAYDDARLFRAELPGDEPLMLVELTNATQEPDGTYKKYWLRVHPELRPMKRDGTLGNPQEFRALNAVASTFGLTGPEYVLTAES